MIPGFGVTEALILLVVVLLLFGAKRIPEFARSLGSGAREFRTAISGEGDTNHGTRDREENEQPTPDDEGAPKEADGEGARPEHAEQGT